MVRMSVLADALKTLTNAEHKGKRQGTLSPFRFFSSPFFLEAKILLSLF